MRGSVVVMTRHDSAADPLSETLHFLHLIGTLYCRAELTAPWSIDMPPIDGSMMFHIITAGVGWLEVDGSTPLLLQPGSLTLIPHGTGHRIHCGAAASPERLFDIPAERVSERYEVMRYGGGGALTLAMCGVVRFDHIAGKRLIERLPRVMQIDSWSEDEASWLASTLRFIAKEASALRPGGETVITHLADILIIQALRSWLESAPEAGTGWLAALRDPQIGKALSNIHRSPAHDWTLESLAEQAAMSRSAFSARFTALTGKSAISYLTEWRMQLARIDLRESDDSLSMVALRVGYQSEAAFCRAFKRQFGQSPGSIGRPNAKQPSSRKLGAAFRDGFLL